ncbi:MAG: SDR family oxidoreductase [Piscinibacter sp.]|nr:SDR family oxidoreductase [Rhizobacter sp.]
MPPTPANHAATVLITGASSGIGEALAHCFARDGYRLVLVARREPRLRALAQALHDAYGARAEVMAADLAQPGAAAALVAALRRRRRTIDVLVNNAGVVAQGEFTRTAAAAHQGMIDLNVAALTAMIAAVLPAMQRRGRGRILNVASIAAFQPVPSLATYAATKAYVLSLTESLAEELRDSGVSVTALCPGITATAMLEQATAHNGKLAALPGFLIGDVEAVAEAGYRACLAGEVIAVPGALNRAAALAAGATPRWLVRRVAGAFGRSVS